MRAGSRSYGWRSSSSSLPAVPHGSVACDPATHDWRSTEPRDRGAERLTAPCFAPSRSCPPCAVDSPFHGPYIRASCLHPSRVPLDRLPLLRARERSGSASASTAERRWRRRPRVSSPPPAASRRRPSPALPLRRPAPSRDTPRGTQAAAPRARSRSPRARCRPRGRRRAARAPAARRRWSPGCPSAATAAPRSPRRRAQRLRQLRRGLTAGVDMFCARCGQRVGKRVSTEVKSAGTLALNAKNRQAGPRIALLGREWRREGRRYTLDRGEAVLGRVRRRHHLRGRVPLAAARAPRAARRRAVDSRPGLAQRDLDLHRKAGEADRRRHHPRGLAAAALPSPRLSGPASAGGRLHAPHGLTHAVGGRGGAGAAARRRQRARLLSPLAGAHGARWAANPATGFSRTIRR